MKTNVIPLIQGDSTTINAPSIPDIVVTPPDTYANATSQNAATSGNDTATVSKPTPPASVGNVDLQNNVTSHNNNASVNNDLIAQNNNVAQQNNIAAQQSNATIHQAVCPHHNNMALPNSTPIIML